MDLIQLRAFVTVAREGNLTRAAELLHVTQPAVSLQIKSLQSSLNLQLFNRIPSGMALTDEVQDIVAKETRRALREHEEEITQWIRTAVRTALEEALKP